MVDLNAERIAAWNDPDLSQLPVSTAVEPAIASADMVFIAVNTPTKNRGLGAGQASDLRWIEACARTVAAHATGRTLPVRTAESVKAILSAAPSPPGAGTSPSFAVLSNPEFLAEGTAIADLEQPDHILRTNLWSSELSKLTANAFLAHRENAPPARSTASPPSAKPPAPTCAKWPGRSVPTAALAESSCKLAPVSAAAASRKTSSTWLSSAATTACTSWPPPGSRWWRSTPGSSTASPAWW